MNKYRKEDSIWYNHNTKSIREKDIMEYQLMNIMQKAIRIGNINRANAIFHLLTGRDYRYID